MSTLTFQYRARDPLGNLLEGNVDAGSAEEAQQQLRRDGFQVLDLEEDFGGPGLLAKRIRTGDIVYLSNQLAVMVDTGITLSTALTSIMEQEENPTMKRMLRDLSRDVESGLDFSSALAKYPKYFDNTYVALVKASEATGSLGQMLDRIATYQRKELDTRSKVRGAMAYPGVMAVLAIGVTFFLLTFVLPKFMPMFKGKGMKLPKPTIFMMAVSEGLTQYWYLWLVLLVALVAGFIYGRRTAPGRRAWDYVKISLPMFGPMSRKVAISRSIRTLGTMLSSGIPILQALELSSKVAGNVYYEALWKDVAEKVTTGSQIDDALRGNPLFPPMLVQMISAGEQTGQLDKVLERVSNYYDSEVDTAIKACTSVIEPLMISVMGVVVGGIAMSLLLPIFSLSSAH